MKTEFDLSDVETPIIGPFEPKIEATVLILNSTSEFPIACRPSCWMRGGCKGCTPDWEERNDS
jgi:hypothetical protein